MKGGIWNSVRRGKHILLSNNFFLLINKVVSKTLNVTKIDIYFCPTTQGHRKFLLQKSQNVLGRNTENYSGKRRCQTGEERGLQIFVVFSLLFGLGLEKQHKEILVDLANIKNYTHLYFSSCFSQSNYMNVLKTYIVKSPAIYPVMYHSLL